MGRHRHNLQVRDRPPRAISRSSQGSTRRIRATGCPAEGKAINWSVVGPRDRAREARIKALYQAGELRTGKDYYRAAMVLQHASRPEDYLLAHEFCVVAAVERGSGCAMASRRHRGSLPHEPRPAPAVRDPVSLRGPDKPVRLYEVGPGVTDALRRELNVPTLDEARKKEARMQEMIQGKKPGSVRKS